MEKAIVTLQDIQEAAQRIQPYIHRTPLLRAESLDEKLGCQTYVKPEMLQITGAFKLRGALNKILSLSPEEQQRGIITSSSGNHAQACAYIGRLLRVPVTVIIPEDAPTLKIKNATAMGARVILWDRSYDGRWEKVHQEVAEHGYTIVHPYEDPLVMAGQGTMALEILNDLSDVNTIVVPIGGGGLISGVSTAIKQFRPDIRVVGVQAAASNAYCQSRIAGKRIAISSDISTVADGLSCRQAGENPYPIIEKNVDELVSVEEQDILEAVRLVANHCKLIAEPSSCVGIAALLSKRISVTSEEKVCHILTSGNWNLDRIGKIFLGEPVESVI